MKNIFKVNDGDAVYLNYPRIMKHEKELDKEYICFVKEHKNTLFKIKLINKIKTLSGIVTFVDNDRWVFHTSDLMLVYSNDRKKHKKKGKNKK